jgi:hypothetical protein
VQGKIFLFTLRDDPLEGTIWFGATTPGAVERQSECHPFTDDS